MADPWFHTEILEMCPPTGSGSARWRIPWGSTSVPGLAGRFPAADEAACRARIGFRVSSREDWAQQGVGDVWDSGRVDSSDCLDVPYAGNPLAPKTAYYWAVQIWDGKGRCFRPQRARPVQHGDHRRIPLAGEMDRAFL